MDPTTEKYVSLTTFKRDGTPVATPVWCTPLGEGRFGFWTSSESGKAKRLARSDRVLVQPSNGRGKVKPGTSPEEGRAKLVTGAEYETIKRQIEEKYGFFAKLTKFFNSVANLFRRRKQPYGDRGVVVTLGAQPG